MTFLTIFYLFSFTLAQIPNVGDGKCYLKNREQKPQGETGICLEAHNKARARKGLRPLKWDNNLASQAQAWSSRLAANGGRLSHSNGG